MNDCRKEIRMANFKERYLEETPVFDAKIPSDEVIDIIIPIYNGLQYFDKLFAGIER